MATHSISSRHYSESTGTFRVLCSCDRLFVANSDRAAMSDFEHHERALSNRPLVTPAHIQPGDVIDTGLGIDRIIERVVIHGVHVYDSGAVSARARYASNPRGIDWGIFIDADQPVWLVSRGVVVPDAHVRTMIPA